MKLDPHSETSKLRKRSPFSSTRLLFVTVSVVVFNGVLLGACILNDDVFFRPDGFFLPYLIGFSLFVGAAIVFAYWRQTRTLIKEGVVCEAIVTDVVRWPRGYWSVTVFYNVNGHNYRKKLHLATHHAAVVDQLGVVFIVVVPSRPKTVEPLYMLAKFGREAKGIIAGHSGLNDEC